MTFFAAVADVQRLRDVLVRDELARRGVAEDDARGLAARRSVRATFWTLGSQVAVKSMVWRSAGHVSTRAPPRAVCRRCRELLDALLSAQAAREHGRLGAHGLGEDGRPV